MELKYGWAKSTKPENPGFNRTFMELKLDKYFAQTAKAYVLIVPLWN